MTKSYLFTSESVSEGHPDKVADQISDSVLDALLEQDPKSRVACEPLSIPGWQSFPVRSRPMPWWIFRRPCAKPSGDRLQLFGYGIRLRELCRYCFPGQTVRDIAQGVNEGEGLDLDQGAGDQGLMFGYACNETEVLMPFPITYSHLLVKKQSEVRKSGQLPWLRPDAKSQVTVRYEDGRPVSVDTVVLSTQHDPDVSHDALSEAIIEEVIKPVLPAK